MNATLPVDASADAAVDLSRLAHLVGHAVTRASLELKRNFTRQLDPLNLKPVEFSTLVRVASNPQVNQKRLGEKIVATMENVTLRVLVPARRVLLVGLLAKVAGSAEGNGRR